MSIPQKKLFGWPIQIIKTILDFGNRQIITLNQINLTIVILIISYHLTYISSLLYEYYSYIYLEELMNYLGFIFVVGGIFSIVCAVMNFNWFMENRKAKLFVTLLSRNGARIFYSIIGAGLVVAGFLMVFGVITLS